MKVCNGTQEFKQGINITANCPN